MQRVKVLLVHKTVHYYWHIVSNKNIHLKFAKFIKIRDYLNRAKSTRLASFLGPWNYSCNCISSFAHINDRLYKLSKSTVVKCTSELTLSFTHFKQSYSNLGLSECYIFNWTLSWLLMKVALFSVRCLSRNLTIHNLNI